MNNAKIQKYKYINNTMIFSRFIDGGNMNTWRTQSNFSTGKSQKNIRLHHLYQTSSSIKLTILSGKHYDARTRFRKP